MQCTRAAQFPAENSATGAIEAIDWLSFGEQSPWEREREREGGREGGGEGGWTDTLRKCRDTLREVAVAQKGGGQPHRREKERERVQRECRAT